MSIFHKQKNYSLPKKNIRFQPTRLNYGRRKQLTISPEKLKYSSNLNIQSINTINQMLVW